MVTGGGDPSDSAGYPGVGDSARSLTFMPPPVVLGWPGSGGRLSLGGGPTGGLGLFDIGDLRNALTVDDRAEGTGC